MSDEERGRYSTESECRELIESLPSECCLRCRFFDLVDDATYQFRLLKAKVSGFCRRYPPTSLTQDGDDTWPLVDGTDWCGEFARTGEERGLGYICADPAGLSEPSVDRIPLSEFAKGMTEGGKSVVRHLRRAGVEYVDQIRESHFDSLPRARVREPTIDKVRKKATEMLGRPNLSP